MGADEPVGSAIVRLRGDPVILRALPPPPPPPERPALHGVGILSVSRRWRGRVALKDPATTKNAGPARPAFPCLDVLNRVFAQKEELRALWRATRSQD